MRREMYGEATALHVRGQGEERRLREDGFCHHWLFEKSLIYGTQEPFGPKRHLCMGLLAARSPSGDIFMGMEILPLSADCY